ncbi:MAG TPA: hypothetical protein VHO25_25315, partial [Polyangiaceae bacterium]|nr:hypothetical protein [Polyangiaceae bacterium]
MQSLSFQSIFHRTTALLVAMVLSYCGLSCSTPKADKASDSDIGATDEATRRSTPDLAQEEVVPTPSQSSPDMPTAAPQSPVTDLAASEESAPPTPESAQAVISMEDRVTPL